MNIDETTVHWRADLMLETFVFVELEPYKYAGYPMLIKTIRMETNDDALFSKSAPLLAAAAELCHHTVNCSALNAEELRRENGIQVNISYLYNHGYLTVDLCSLLDNYVCEDYKCFKHVMPFTFC